MRLGAFVRAYMGRAMGSDRAFGAQCVVLCNEWASRGAYRSTFAGNALAIAGQFRAGWRWVPNGPTNAPPPGAIVVWVAYNPRAHTGAYGHCAICLFADADSLVSLDQNWREVPAATLVLHTYDGVAGWQQPDPLLG